MKTRTLFLVALGITLAACSGIRQREDADKTLQRYMDYAGEPVSTVSTLSRFDGWRPLSRDKLAVWTSLDQAYLLTVEPSCQNLEFTDRIAITSTTGWVQSGFDYVRLPHRERCRILEIRPVDYKQLRAAERAAG